MYVFTHSSRSKPRAAIHRSNYRLCSMTILWEFNLQINNFVVFPFFEISNFLNIFCSNSRVLTRKGMFRFVICCHVTLLMRKIFLHSFLDLLYKLIVANIAITAYKPENKKQKKSKYSFTKVTHIHRKDLYKFQHLHEKISKACKLPCAFFITGPQ